MSNPDWLLTDKEINQIADELGYEPDYEEYRDAEIAIAKAQAKKLMEYLEGCQTKEEDGAELWHCIPHRYWKALKKEVGLED